MDESRIEVVPGRRVVVGVDDSAGSHAALRWAAREAELRDAELWMVHAFTYPVSIAWHTVPVLPRLDCCDRAAEEMLARIELDQLGSHPGLRVRHVAMLGTPHEVLVDASADAELVVVGGLGRPSLREAVIGAVAKVLERRAYCPVVVVHATDCEEEPRTVGHHGGSVHAQDVHSVVA